MEKYNPGCCVVIRLAMFVPPAPRSNSGDKEKIKVYSVTCSWQIVKQREIDYQTGLGWEGMPPPLPWSQL